MKEKQIKVLKTNIPLWNRYVRFCRSVNPGWIANLSFANLRFANLRSANLRSANLRYADLRFANLSSANLRYADLYSANLSSADLSSADLYSANLSSADLSSADLDFSCLPLSCGSLKMKTDARLRIQIAYHFASLIKYGFGVTEEEKEIFEKIKNYANKIHRYDVEKL